VILATLQRNAEVSTAAGYFVDAEVNPMAMPASTTGFVSHHCTGRKNNAGWLNVCMFCHCKQPRFHANRMHDS